MPFTTDKLYDGLIVGILVGLALQTIINYTFKTKCTSQNTKSVGKSQQQEPESIVNKKGEFKMALLVRHDLKMGKGKVAAQVRQFELKYILEFKCFKLYIFYSDLGCYFWGRQILFNC